MEKTKNNWWFVVVALILGLLIGTFLLANLFGKEVSLAPKSCMNQFNRCNLECNGDYNGCVDVGYSSSRCGSIWLGCMGGCGDEFHKCIGGGSSVTLPKATLPKTSSGVSTTNSRGGLATG